MKTLHGAGAPGSTPDVPPPPGGATLPPPPPRLGPERLVGTVIGERYAVEAIIGRGGYGTVYRARHVRTDDTLAVKVLRASTLDDPSVAERFAREAKLASSLKHPNTLQVIDYGELQDGSPYLVMPFLQGQTLSDLLAAEGPISPDRLVHIASQVLGSLAEAHARGIVHRDLKPDNIYLQTVHGKEDYVRVLDFGIAKTLDEADQDLTQSGTVVGTPRYMSPEQAQGRAVDGRSDLFTLGVILFEALSGLTPHLGETPLATILKRVTEDAPDLHSALLLPSPRGLCDAVLRAMSRDPAARFANADEMAVALRAGLQTPIEPSRALATTAVAPPGAVPTTCGPAQLARAPASAPPQRPATIHGPAGAAAAQASAAHAATHAPVPPPPAKVAPMRSRLAESSQTREHAEGAAPPPAAPLSPGPRRTTQTPPQSPNSSLAPVAVIAGVVVALATAGAWYGLRDHEPGPTELATPAPQSLESKAPSEQAPGPDEPATEVAPPAEAPAPAAVEAAPAPPGPEANGNVGVEVAPAPAAPVADPHPGVERAPEPTQAHTPKAVFVPAKPKARPARKPLVHGAPSRPSSGPARPGDRGPSRPGGGPSRPGR